MDKSEYVHENYRVLVYTTSGCLYSYLLRAMLKEKKVVFREVNVHHYPLCIDDLVRWSGKLTLPQGYYEVKRLVENGKLKKMIRRAKSKKSKVDCVMPSFLPPPVRSVQTVDRKHLVLNPVLDEAYEVLLGGVVKKNKKNSFKANDYIAYIMKSRKLQKEAAIKFANRMKSDGYIIRTKHNERDISYDSTSLRLYSDEAPYVLNNRLCSPSTISNPQFKNYPPHVVSLLLLDLVNILRDFVDEENQFDYDGVKASPDFKIFLNDIHELHKLTLSELNVKELTMFLLTLFKLLFLHTTIVMGGLPIRADEHHMFYTQYGYVVNGKKNTLSSLSCALRQSKPSKELKKDKMVETSFFESLEKEYNVDPRIYFASVHTDVFSLPIIIYDYVNYDPALQWSTEALCTYAIISRSERRVILPFFFSLVQADIEMDNTEYLTWLVMFMRDEKEAKLRLMLGDNKAIEIVYKKYPWEVHALSLFEQTLFESDTIEEEESDLEPEEFLVVETNANAVQLIDEVKKSAEPKYTLNLESSDLTCFPSELLDIAFVHLRKLVLSRNTLLYMPLDVAYYLNSLTYVYLNGNKLKKIPECIGELRDLEYLDISCNSVETIPNNFCSLRKLRQLYLQDNMIKALPLGFSQLRALEDLNLSNNQISQLPPNFSELVLLEILDLHSNQISDLPSMENFQALEDLNVRDNNISEIPITLGYIKSLVSLDLSRNGIKVYPRDLCRYANIIEINLADNKIKKLPPKFGYLTTLRRLDISNNPIVEPPPESCGDITAIQIFFGQEPRQTTPLNDANKTISRTLSTREKRRV